jgi:uncharacterized protein (DUF58 family)
MAVASTSIELTLRGRVVAWLAALAAGASWLGDDTNARLAAALLAAPLLVDFVAKQRRLHKTTIRVGARRTVAGAVFTESLELVHNGRWPLRECLLTEPRTMRTEQPALLPTVPSGAPVRIEVRQRSWQRSHVLERVFLLVCHWPLGMFQTRSVVNVAADLVTEPARVTLQAELVRAIAETEAAPRDRSHADGPEFHSLREHQAGTDARAVHALRSATLGTLVARVTHGRMPRTVGIVLDLRRPPRRPLNQGHRRFEWSLGACASLLHELRTRGAEARVLVLAGEPADILVQGPARTAELLMLLAEASPTPHHVVPATLFATVQALEHCFWIPAGAYLAAPEFAAMPGTVTLVGGEFE